ncbi:MAG: methionine synthase [Streptococcaceae bacterium]|jgi:hypothetical protein|nr:methionine synthase [Streptococcaceae bacterium]
MIPLRKQEILRYLGYRRGQELTPEVSTLIDELSLEVQERSHARYLWRIFDFEILSENEIQVLGTDLKLRGTKINHHLRKAQKVALLTGTLGIEIERAIRLYEVSELTKARILDACCVEYIERLLDLAEVEIDHEMAEYTLNSRFSPGYGDLPLIPTQKEFLAAMDATKTLGINLTATSLMVPRKSVTAIIGLFEDEKLAKPRRKAPEDLTVEMVQNGKFNIGHL